MRPLKTRKLFILHNARNAQNAKKPPSGYATATRRGVKPAGSTESLKLEKVWMYKRSQSCKVEPSFLDTNRSGVLRTHE